MRDTILWRLRAQECAWIDCDTKYEWISDMKKLFENWNRYLKEDGANRFAYFMDDFKRRLSKASPEERTNVLSFVEGLLGLGDEPAQWAEGEREETINDITSILARASDPSQEPASDEELQRMRLPRDFVLFTMDNKAARAIMKSIRLLLALPRREQVNAYYHILSMNGLAT